MSSNIEPCQDVRKFWMSTIPLGPIITLDWLNCYMGRAMQKRVFEHMRTAKAQISLGGCAVGSGPSLFANRIIGHQKMYEWRANARMRLWARAGWSEYAHIVHVQRHVFAWCYPYVIAGLNKICTITVLSISNMAFSGYPDMPFHTRTVLNLYHSLGKFSRVHIDDI